MGLSSLFSKKPQESDATEGTFSSRAEEDSNAARGRTRRKAGKSANTPVDPVLPEKKRARRRLIGAVALVLAAVIGLPLVLDSEPKPLGDDVVIQIPSKDQSPVPMPVPAAAGDGTIHAAMPIAQSAALDPTEEVIESPGTGSAVKGDAAVAPAKHGEVAKPAIKVKNEASVAAAKVAAKPETKPKSDSADTTEASLKPAVLAGSRESARARAILDGGDASAKANVYDSKKPLKMMVQVAALASKEKVLELQDKLKAAGIVSHTQTVATDTGERIRVRIGPFGSKEEADKARAKLSDLGLHGALVPG